MSYRASNLPTEKHAFLGRKGGISEGVYERLNVSCICQDDKDCVQKNRQMVAEVLGGDIGDLMFLRQNATIDVAFVEEPSREKVTADGMVTKTPGIILGIKTADCLPVLLADYKRGVIGVAHAGWRGAVRGVVENTLNLMLEHGAELNNIVAALGPCIQQPSFEVGVEVRDECNEIDSTYLAFFERGGDNDHFQFDLEGLVKYRLEQFGVKNITVSGIDTYADEENYFSFRRNTHRGLIKAERDFPCHVSLIKL